MHATEASSSDDTTTALLDWKLAHKKLVELAKQQAGLDSEIGRWLLYAQRAAVPAWLGYSSLREYAERLFGFSPRQTTERLRAAEALEQLPLLTEALACGELCWSAVRELTRVAAPETEAEWLAAARGRSAHAVEQMVRGRRHGSRPGDPVDRQALDKVLRFELSPQAYATVQEALAKIRRETGGRLDDADALLEMARRALGGPRDEGRSSYQLAVTVCASCKRGFQQARGELVELGPEAVEMACCDAQHIGETHAGTDAPAGHDTGASTEPNRNPNPNPKSRAKQSIPPRIRRLVLRRAGGRCEVPDCKNSLRVDVHHSRLRSEGGDDNPAHLVVLCGPHHAATHEGRMHIEGDAPTGWSFRHADGATYGGGSPSAELAEAAVKVFRALRSLGFRERDCKMKTHVGNAQLTEQMLRAALGVLTPATPSMTAF